MTRSAAEVEGGQEIIGVEQETRYYAIGGLTFKMIPITQLRLPEADKVLKAVESLNGFEGLSLVDGLVAMYGRILDPVITIENEPFFCRLQRRLKGVTPVQMLGLKAKVLEVGEVLQDFFVINFGSTQPSGPSFASTILSSARMGKPPLKTSS